MLDFEYNNIINEMSKRFNVIVPEGNRNSLIKLHKLLEKMNAHGLVDFEKLCKNVIIESKLAEKYPKLGLFERMYAEHNMN